MVEKIKVVEITDELKTAYLDYALSVIISRALPDVRDGLKPVQRRILYTMKELGLWAKEKFTKCANICGNVIARYHPHGDQAVYDALVRLAQDFSLRYPLVQGQGNFGSIDGDPPAAYRYCVTGDTLVVTNRCLEKIEEISAKEDISNVGLKVLSFNKKINKVSKWFDSGIHPIIRIETYRGYSLKGTPNHPILVLEKDLDGKPVFVWKTLAELKLGDYAVIDRSNDLLWPEEDLTLENFYPQVLNSGVKIKKLPLKLNPSLTFFLGFALAEGCLVESKKRHYKKLIISLSDKKIALKILKILKENFSDLDVYFQKRKPAGWTKRPYYSLEICSSYVIEFLENLGLVKCKAEEKEIPKIIFEGTKKTVGAFLRGLFEGEGSVFGYITKNPQVRLVSKSYQLIKTTQVLLLRFGIVSFLRFSKKRDYFYLIINGKKNLELFLKYINFESSEKRKRLKMIANQSTGKAISHSDFIPFLGNYLRNKYKKSKIGWKFKAWLEKHNLDRYEKLKIYLPILKQFLQEEDINLVEFLLKNNYLFDRIIKKDKEGFNKVYSLKVESSCHSFISNGFLSHNTEAKLTKIAEEMLVDIDKETVDFRPNYDNTRREPVVLPSRIPNLIINGALGIAVGMATSIPPHNLEEILTAVKEIIKNPQITLKELLNLIKGPDFPTGGVVYGKKSLIEVYKTGRGSIVVRGKAKIERTKRGKEFIVITEIPWQVNKAELVTQIANLALNKNIPEIKEVRDESNKEGIRIVIELKEGGAEKVVDKLYRLTDLEKRFYYNLIALEDGIQPKVFDLKSLLLQWIEYRRQIILRRTKYDLERTKERIEILEGLQKALNKIDLIIKIIRKSKDKEEAKRNLKQKIKITERQAEAILEMPLRTLTALEISKILAELKEKLKLKGELEKILAQPKKINEVIVNECDEIIKKYADPRKTEIVYQDVEAKKVEEEIPLEDVILLINRNKFVRTFKLETPLEKIIKTKDDVGKIILARTDEKLLAYSHRGKIYSLSVYDFYLTPKYLESNLIIDKNDGLIEAFKHANRDLIVITKKGLGKKIKSEEAIVTKRTGSQIIKLNKDDSVIKILPDYKTDLILVSAKGYALGLKDDLPYQGKSSRGVKIMKLNNDEIVAVDYLNKDFIVCFFANGYVKKVPTKEINAQKRGGKGVKLFEAKEKFGQLIFAGCLSNAERLIISDDELKIISVNDLPITKRVNQPIKILAKINLVEVID